MYYDLLVIILHRPFCSKRYVQPKPRVGKGFEHARSSCIKASVDISRLLTCYKRLHGLRKTNIQVVHIAFTAALIFVYAIVSGVGMAQESDLVAHLDVCCSALADLGETFANASRALDVLLAIKRSWQARILAQS